DLWITPVDVAQLIVGHSQYRNAVASGEVIGMRTPPDATLYMKGRPRGVSLELLNDFKLAPKENPYENVLCGDGCTSGKHRDRGFEWSRESGRGEQLADGRGSGTELPATAEGKSVGHV